MATFASNAPNYFTTMCFLVVRVRFGRLAKNCSTTSASRSLREGESVFVLTVRLPGPTAGPAGWRLTRWGTGNVPSTQVAALNLGRQGSVGDNGETSLFTT